MRQSKTALRRQTVEANESVLVDTAVFLRSLSPLSVPEDDDGIFATSS